MFLQITCYIQYSKRWVITSFLFDNTRVIAVQFVFRRRINEKDFHYRFLLSMRSAIIPMARICTPEINRMTVVMSINFCFNKSGSKNYAWRENKTNALIGKNILRG